VNEDTPIITAQDLGVKSKTTPKRTCARCPNKLSMLNGHDLCYACQSAARRIVLNGPIVAPKRRRPHADTI
jgi:hypothetical protein